MAPTALTLLPARQDPRGGAARAHGQAVRRALVDGLVIYSTAHDDPGTLGALRRDLPTVIVEQPDPDELADRVLPAARTAPLHYLAADNRHGAKLAAEHVTRLGHVRIGVLFGSGGG